MGFGFLAPLFLAGLAAVAIPVLVHLTHRERREPVVFPSLMFLNRIPFRTQRRQRLRHLLLFALRTAAIVLLVAAFARPFLDRSAVTAAGGRDIIVLMDRSASMGAGGRWALARAAAREAIAALPSGARLGIVAFDERAEAVTELTSDGAQLEAALDRLVPGSGAGRFAPGLQAAIALAEGAGGSADAVLISDFQRSGWDGGAATRLPAGMTLRPVDVGDTSLVNNAIIGLLLERDPGAVGRLGVTARIAATGGAGRDVPVSLEVDGRVAETVRVRLEPGATGLARFASLRDPEAPRRARVTLGADAQPADDAWHVVLGPAPRLAVLMLTRADAPPRDAIYLRRALGVAADPAFPVVARTGAAVSAADLAATSVVLLHDAPFPAGDAGRRVLEWVRGGGGLMIALGARGTLPSDLADSLGPGTEVADRGESGASAAGVEATHPVFEGWGAEAGLGASRTFRYRRLERALHAPARWDDGAAALAEVRLGAGRVLVWTADFANRWSDLPLQPTFVPLMHGAVRYLAGFTPPAPSRLVGDVAELPAAGGTIVVEQPSGRRQALRAGEPARVVLTERGFYAVRATGDASAASLIAANVPPSEADPARLVPEQLARAVAADSTQPVPLRAGADPATRERGQRLWWYALIAVMLLFATESAVAHRMRGNR